MMLYAQDEFGYLGDEILEEIAKRLDLNIVQVTETLAYYSMLRRKPAGRYHMQVCTNISCMLRGGNELYRARPEAPGHRQQGSLAERHVFARRSGMHGRLHRRAGHAGELRFLRKSRSGQSRRDFRAASGRQEPQARSGHLRLGARTPSGRSAGDQQALRHPQFAQDRRLSAARRLSGARKSAQANDARADHRRSEKIESARARRRGLPHRHEVELRSQGVGQAEIHSRQRRRERARHMQGSPADGNGSRTS